MEEYTETIVRYRCLGREARVSGWRVIQVICDGLYREGLYPGQIHGTGSMYEGLPVEVCNDEDYMFIHKDNPVVVHQQAHVAPPQGFLIYDINPSNSAYLTLRTVPGVEYTCSTRIQGCIQQSGNHDYVSSSRFVNNTFRGNANIQETHGPAGVGMVNPAKPEYGTQDFVLCLSCLSWPPCASEFLNRPRHHGWPPQSLLDKIQQAGCHVVPVGHPRSENTDIEWRLSFSVAERELLHNISDKMFMVMYAIKIIKNQHWRQDESEVTIFCSYFIKTACLWVCEETDKSNISMMDLCRKVIDWLVTCYRTHKLPHYFIPEQNLIEHLEIYACANVIGWFESIENNLSQNIMLFIPIDTILLRSLLSLKTEMIATDKMLKNFHFLPTNGNTIVKQTITCMEFINERFGSDIVTSQLLEKAAYLIHQDKRIFKQRKRLMNSTLADELVNNLCITLSTTNDQLPSALLCIPEKILLHIIARIDSLVSDKYTTYTTTCLHRGIGDAYMMLYFRLLSTLAANISSTSWLRTRNEPSHLQWQNLYIQCMGDCYKRVVQYYTQGLEMVHPDGWSDRGLGGYVRLATFYHLSSAKGELGKVLAKMENLLEWGRQVDVLLYLGVRTIYLIFSNCLESPWAQDRILWNTLIKPHHGSFISIHPVILGYYLLARFTKDLREKDKIIRYGPSKIQAYCVWCEQVIRELDNSEYLDYVAAAKSGQLIVNIMDSLDRQL